MSIDQYITDEVRTEVQQEIEREPIKPIRRMTYKELLAERKGLYDDSVLTPEVRSYLDRYYTALRGEQAYIGSKGKEVRARTYKKRLEFAQKALEDLENHIVIRQRYGRISDEDATSVVEYAHSLYNTAVKENKYLRYKKNKEIEHIERTERRIGSLEEKVKIVSSHVMEAPTLDTIEPAYLAIKEAELLLSPEKSFREQVMEVYQFFELPGLDEHGRPKEIESHALRGIPAHGNENKKIYDNIYDRDTASPIISVVENQDRVKSLARLMGGTKRLFRIGGALISLLLGSALIRYHETEKGLMPEVIKEKVTAI